MENTLQINDRVAVNKLPFVSGKINRGDVVVFRDPDSWLPEPDESNNSTVVSKIKDGLVLVGVLPNPAKQYLVKRVIGIAGDRIVCCTDKKLTINGTPVDEPYIFKGNVPSDMTFDITVDPGKIWVMGDHRGASADSRYHQDDINKGQVPLSRVTGRVFGVIWPFANAKIVPSVPVLK
jgi:signal peptidase I